MLNDVTHAFSSIDIDNCLMTYLHYADELGAVKLMTLFVYSLCERILVIDIAKENFQRL